MNIHNLTNIFSVSVIWSCVHPERLRFLLGEMHKVTDLSGKIILLHVADSDKKLLASEISSTNQSHSSKNHLFFPKSFFRQWAMLNRCRADFVSENSFPELSDVMYIEAYFHYSVIISLKNSTQSVSNSIDWKIHRFETQSDWPIYMCSDIGSPLDYMLTPAFQKFEGPYALALRKVACPTQNFAKFEKGMVSANCQPGCSPKYTFDQKEMFNYTSPIPTPNYWVYFVCVCPFQKPISKLLLLPFLPRLSQMPKRNNPVAPTAREKEPAYHVVVLLLDALSSAHARRSLPAFLSEVDKFGYISKFENLWVNGYNSIPNWHRIFCDDDCKNPDKNLFDLFNRSNYVTMENIVYCQRYPDIHGQTEIQLSVENALWCQFRGDLTGLYVAHPNPGCVEGGFAIDQILTQLSDVLIDVDAAQQRLFAVVSPNEAHTSDMSRAAMLDRPLVDFFQRVPAAVRASTVFVIVSDHGIHGHPESAHDVRMEAEHRNPFFLVVSPFPNPVPDNANKLLSHKDVYATLRAFAAAGRSSSPPAPPPGSSPPVIRSHNLFADLVSENRTCSQASIPPAWCNCWTLKKASL